MTHIKVDKRFKPHHRESLKEKSPQVYFEICKLRLPKKICSKIDLQEAFDFPSYIQSMTDEEIWEGAHPTKEEIEAGGHIGGHGLYNPITKEVKINPYMGEKAVLLNFIHENLHHVFPEVREKVVDILTHLVGCRVGINKDRLCNSLEELQ